MTDSEKLSEQRFIRYNVGKAMHQILEALSRCNPSIVRRVGGNIIDGEHEVRISTSVENACGLYEAIFSLQFACKNWCFNDVRDAVLRDEVLKYYTAKSRCEDEEATNEHEQK